MKHDFRYSTVQVMYEKGRIKSLFDIFIYIKKTRVGLDIGMRVNRLNKFLNKVEAFTLTDIERIALLCGIDLAAMMDLWRKEYEIQKEIRKRK